MKNIGVIGGAGFIGSHIVKRFLEAGHKVKVSITDSPQSHKYEHLKQLKGSDQLVLEPLDLKDEGSIQRFIKDQQIVVHTGTPFQLEVQDPEQDLMVPTVLGTQRFLEASQSVSQLEKLVIIASAVAFNTQFPLPPPYVQGDQVITERSPRHYTDDSHPYAQAKFKANEAVEQFIQTHRNLPFEVVTLSPVFVVGQALSDREDSTSVNLQSIFHSGTAPNDFLQMFFDEDVEFALVGVEDVARAAYEASHKSGLHGQHMLLSSESWPVSDMVRMLKGAKPRGKGLVKYSGAAAEQQLNMKFAPAVEALNAFARGQLANAAY